MTGVCRMAGLECENDVGLRFTFWLSGDSHGTSCLSAGMVESYASAAKSVSTAGAAPTGTGATPRPKGLVRARGHARFHTPVPAPWGVAPGRWIPADCIDELSNSLYMNDLCVE